MLKKIAMTAIAVGAVALGAPVAHATHAQWDCGFESLANETATGGQDTYTGAAYGYIVGAAGETVSIRCYVEVAGSEVTGASTPNETGTTGATTAGQVTFTATEGQSVKLCGQWSAGTESGSECFESTHTEFPPQAVIDLLDTVFTAVDQLLFDITSIPDATICPVFASLAPGVPGVVDISTFGDISIAGEPFWDCPPYEV